MNNFIDLTEKRVFKDEPELFIDDIKKVPWKKKSYEYELEEHEGRGETSSFHDPYDIIFRYGNNDTYINITNFYPNNYFDIVYDTYNSTTSTTYTTRHYKIKATPVDIFGKSYKLKETGTPKIIPWKKLKMKDDGMISHYLPWRKRKNIYNFPDDSSLHIPFVGCVFNDDSEFGWKTFTKNKNDIPWHNYTKGEKNPINTWDLPDDFYDSDIEMPKDSWFLGRIEREWQIGIN